MKEKKKNIYTFFVCLFFVVSSIEYGIIENTAFKKKKKLIYVAYLMFYCCEMKG